MANVKFNYKGIETIVQCNLNDKIKDIYIKYETKIRKDISELYFLYNGNKINDNLNLNEIINEEDKKRNIMNILVNDNNEAIIKENEKISNEIICPNCKESILLKINKYKINLYNCKNNHKINNILINEYENMEKIDISKIICDECKKKNKSNTYNNEFYRCNICKINICPLCKSNHNNNHKIINYNNKNYICEIHNMNYIRYCKDCKLNICMMCFKEHKNHSVIDYGDIIISNEDNVSKKNKFEEYINKLNNIIDKIIKILNEVKENMKKYFNIYNNIINNYYCENINYEILYNINEFNKYNNNIIKDISEIVNDYNINNKFNNIINIYNKMNINNSNRIFEKDPNNLKYILDITNTNDIYGGNDIFEVFKSYKDNKGYVISPNIKNHNLDIFALLDNKLIKSLHGHKNEISTIRYFINNKDYNEYLISTDKDYIAIIWDITNNYILNIILILNIMMKFIVAY